MCPAHVYWFVYIFITMCMKHQSLFIGYEVVRLTQSVFLWKILECLVVGGKKWTVCVQGEDKRKYLGCCKQRCLLELVFWVSWDKYSEVEFLVPS